MTLQDNQFTFKSVLKLFNLDLTHSQCTVAKIAELGFAYHETRNYTSSNKI